MTDSLAVPQIDLRRLTPAERQPALLALFQHLQPGDAFDLLSDEAPAALQQQLQAHWPGQFSWTEAGTGPTLWQARVSRLPAGRSCCGCCGG